MDPMSSEGMDIREALTSPLDYTGMPLSVKLEAPVASGAKKKVGSSLLVPANAATVDASDNDRLNLEIWYVVRNVMGEDVSHNSKLYNLNLNAAYVAQLQTSGIGYNDTLELPPGQYGFWVTLPAADLPALHALTTAAYNAQGFLVISVNGQTWLLPRVRAPFTGPLEMVLPAKDQVLLLHSLLFPGPVSQPVTVVNSPGTGT